MRPFHVSPKIDTGHDASPIDFAFMPEHTLEASSPPEIMRVPLLPDNSTPLPQSQNHQETIEPVVRPQISTISANSTHIESPSSMTEVTDNHAIDLDPFNLTSKVVASASKAIDTSVKEDQEPGAVKELWNGLLDDLFGSKKLGRT